MCVCTYINVYGKVSVCSTSTYTVAVLQCVAVCCVAVFWGVLYCSVLQCVVVCCSVLQCLVAECCSVLHRIKLGRQRYERVL